MARWGRGHETGEDGKALPVERALENLPKSEEEPTSLLPSEDSHLSRQMYHGCGERDSSDQSRHLSPKLSNDREKDCDSQ
jgi:hypothetical protein